MPAKMPISMLVFSSVASFQEIVHDYSNDRALAGYQLKYAKNECDAAFHFLFWCFIVILVHFYWSYLNL